jgi:hypothetical protein
MRATNISEIKIRRPESGPLPKTIGNGPMKMTAENEPDDELVVPRITIATPTAMRMAPAV